MRIFFSAHSLEKIGQRNLSRQKIIETVKNPNFILDSYDDRLIAIRNYGQLDLRVIYQIENSAAIIITAYWHERRKK